MSVTLIVKNLMKRLSGCVAKAIFPKVGKLLRIKPSLSYLELHLTDRCNLNCKGCGHFSTLADEWFADPGEYLRDMQQLQRLFSTIRVIRLLGGEPLLSRDIAFFLFSTRSYFPKADIRIATNGILLHEMSETFWEACRSCSIALDITLYPPIEKKEKALIELAHAKGVETAIQKTTSFYALYNKNGDSDANISFRQCRNRWYCPMLREGKVYICAVPALIHYFNKRFGTDIPRAGFVDIYAPNLTGWDVIEVLDKSSSTCRYCTLGWDRIPSFPWSTSKRTMKEWDATSSAICGSS